MSTSYSYRTVWTWQCHCMDQSCVITCNIGLEKGQYRRCRAIFLFICFCFCFSPRQLLCYIPKSPVLVCQYSLGNLFLAAETQKLMRIFLVYHFHACGVQSCINPEESPNYHFLSFHGSLVPFLYFETPNLQWLEGSPFPGHVIDPTRSGAFSCPLQQNIYLPAWLWAHQWLGGSCRNPHA